MMENIPDDVYERVIDGYSEDVLHNTAQVKFWK